MYYITYSQYVLCHKLGGGFWIFHTSTKTKFRDNAKLSVTYPTIWKAKSVTVEHGGRTWWKVVYLSVKFWLPNDKSTTHLQMFCINTLSKILATYHWWWYSFLIFVNYLNIFLNPLTYGCFVSRKLYKNAFKTLYETIKELSTVFSASIFFIFLVESFD